MIGGTFCSRNLPGTFFWSPSLGASQSASAGVRHRGRGGRAQCLCAAACTQPPRPAFLPATPDSGRASDHAASICAPAVFSVRVRRPFAEPSEEAERDLARRLSWSVVGAPHGRLACELAGCLVASVCVPAYRSPRTERALELRRTVPSSSPNRGRPLGRPRWWPLQPHAGSLYPPPAPRRLRPSARETAPPFGPRAAGREPQKKNREGSRKDPSRLLGVMDRSPPARPGVERAHQSTHEPPSGVKL